MTARVPLVLVPGLACDEDLFAAQSAGLADVADVVIPDIRAARSVVEMAQVVLDAAPDRFALGGLSLGGYVVLEVLRQARHRVDRVALLDTSARPEVAEQTARRRALLALADDRGFDAAMQALWTSEVAPSRVSDTSLRERFLDMCGRCGPEVFRRQTEAIIGRADGRPALPGLNLPLLVLCGRQDAITPLDGHEEMARLAPQSRLVVLEDCGHLSSWERPEAVNAELRTWLADGAGTGARGTDGATSGG